ncbi:MAG: hypothetical protein GC193_00770 [Cryomorphaceae bacterium]|nr:hypothetical protein [Cryomorphaceae bacterium]
MQKVHIPAPCPMIFSKMEPVAGGRFCNGCKKTVYDVSGFSEDDLTDFLNDKKQGVCVSALSDQLAPSNRTTWFKVKFAAAVMLAFFGFQMKPMAQTVKQKSDYPVVYKKDKNTHIKELKCYDAGPATKRRFRLFRKKKTMTARMIGCPSF